MISRCPMTISEYEPDLKRLTVKNPRSSETAYSSSRTNPALFVVTWDRVDEVLICRQPAKAEFSLVIGKTLIPRQPPLSSVFDLGSSFQGDDASTGQRSIRFVHNAAGN